MKYGMMNHPAASIEKEIKWAYENGFDFIDLTYEPPVSLYKDTNAENIKKILKKYSMKVIGHTAWHLPFNSPYSSIRKAAVNEFIKAAEFFKKTGAEYINMHITSKPIANYIKFEDTAGYYIEAIKKIYDYCCNIGLNIMIEHIDGSNAQIKMIEAVFENIPDVYFHLDIGHANLNTDSNKTELLFKKFGDKLFHAHMSDNWGKGDEHLPLGAGNINWKKIVRILKKFKYNKTITFEVFSRDKNYLIYSKKKIEGYFNEDTEMQADV